MDTSSIICIFACAFAVVCLVYARQAFVKLRKIQQVQYQILYDESLDQWERSKYQARVADLESENNMLKAAFVAAESGSKKTKEAQLEISKLTQELRASRGQEQSAKAQAERLDRDLEKCRKDLGVAESENTKLLHSMHEERNRSQQSTELARRTQKAEEALEKAKKQNKKLEEEAVAFRKWREDCERQMRFAQQAAEAADAERRLLKEEIAGLGQHATNSRAQIAQLQAKLSDEQLLKRQLQTLNEKLTAAQSRCADLEVSLPRDLRTLTSQLEQERMKTAALETELKSFTRAMEEDERVRECVVCLSALKSVMFEPCRHCCTCRDCGQKLTECPLCKRPIRRRKHVYV